MYTIKQKKLIIITIMVIFLLLSGVYFLFRVQQKQIVTSDAAKLHVANIEQINFEIIFESNIVWYPGEENGIACLRTEMVKNESDSKFHQETIVYKLDLSKRTVTDIVNLYQYGVNKGDGIDFYWSVDGNYLVTGEGSVVNFKREEGYQMEYENQIFGVIGISNDEEIILAQTNNSGLLFFDTKTKLSQSYIISTDVFSLPYSGLALSNNGQWIAAGSYSTDNVPNDVFEALVAPQALYILNSSGNNVKLIADNIQGNIEYASFSPDDTKIIWIVEYENSDQSIFIANIDGSGAHEIFTNAGLSYDYNIMSNVVWSPDGNRLVFVGSRGEDFIYPVWILSLGNEE